MPHQCVQCNTFFPDGSKEILSGCSVCGGKFFFYVKQENVDKAKEKGNALSKKQKKQIEKDVLDIIGDDFEHDRPVVLDIESINIISPGKYEIDLVNLFAQDQPLVYKLEEGKYVVDIIETFRRRNEEIGDAAKKGKKKNSKRPKKSKKKD